MVSPPPPGIQLYCPTIGHHHNTIRESSGQRPTAETEFKSKFDLCVQGFTYTPLYAVHTICRRSKSLSSVRIISGFLPWFRDLGTATPLHQSGHQQRSCQALGNRLNPSLFSGMKTLNSQVPRVDLPVSWTVPCT